jgi:hypothetical protein
MHSPIPPNDYSCIRMVHSFLGTGHVSMTAAPKDVRSLVFQSGRSTERIGPAVTVAPDTDSDMELYFLRHGETA